jgi:protocatechuate 3,4-dioxygenase beta subunit
MQNPDGTRKAAEVSSVEGRVLSLAGEPLRKAVVSLEPAADQGGRSDDSHVAITDAEGHFSLTSVEPGDYRLWAERTGYLRGSYGTRQQGQEGAVITLTPAQRLTDVVLRLTPEASVVGRIVDEDRDPLEDVTVRLFRYNYAAGQRRVQLVAATGTDAAGAFKLDRIAPGRYYLMAVPQKVVLLSATSASGKGEKAEYSYLTTYYPGVAEAADAQQILVSPGESHSLVDLPLRKTRVFHVRGRVNASALAPGAGHTVIRAFPNDSRTAVLGFEGPEANLSPQDGSFDLAGVAPGSYTLMVTTAFGRFRILGRQSLEVGDADVNNVTLVLPPRVAVSGTIVYAGGSPPDSRSARDKAAPSPDIALLSGDPGSFDAPPGQRVRGGSFHFPDVSPARYSVRVTDIPEDAYLQSIRSSGGEDLIANDFDLTSGGGRREIAVTLNRSPARIDGSLQDGDGRHLADIVVTLAPRPLDLRQSHRYLRTLSDKDGRFSLRGLPPGNYCLYLWDELDEGDELNSELLERSAGRCHEVELHENDKKSLDLIFQPEMERVQ